MQTLEGYEALCGLERRYDDFIDDSAHRGLAVLGRPFTGKRWLLKKVLDRRGIAVRTISGYMDIPSFREFLQGNSPLVFENMSGSLFGKKAYRDILMEVMAGSAGSGRKVIIIDDPYTSRKPELEAVLNGVSYTFLLRDLFRWTASIKDSLAEAKGLKASSIDRILDVYRRCLERGLVSENADLSGSQFSIHGITQAAADLERNGYTTALSFPQELFPFLARPLPEIAGDTVRGFAGS